MTRAVKWTFTLNNFTEEDEAKIQAIDCIYLVYGREHLQEGTPHLQGYIHFSTRKTFNTIKKLIGDRAHIEKAVGTPQQNKDYCTKEDKNFFEKGQLPPDENPGGQATKRKWEEAKQAAREGRFDEIPADLWIRYRKAFKDEYTEHVNSIPKPIEEYNMTLKDHFFWIYGPTGTGKSHMARSLAGLFDKNNPPYLKGIHKWWSGYKETQKVVLIEEASPEKCRYMGDYFKLWLDKWPFSAETKGGSYEHGIRPQYIIITSNYRIEECFNQTDADAMKRRVTEFYKASIQAWLPINLPEEDTVPLPNGVPENSVPNDNNVIIDNLIVDEHTILKPYGHFEPGNVYVKNVPAKEEMTD